MSMLADKRRRVKWTLNPTGRSWSNDKTKLGQRMLEKMGWKEGFGLGVELQGQKEHIKVSAKNDSKGLGFKGGDSWSKIQEDYERTLAEVSANYEVDDDFPTHEKKSLEEISRSSRAQIHHAKFIRGKDVSQYSEKDLACSFGKPLHKIAPESVAVSCGSLKAHSSDEQSRNRVSSGVRKNKKLRTMEVNMIQETVNNVRDNEDNLNCENGILYGDDPLGQCHEQDLKYSTKKRKMNGMTKSVEEDVNILDSEQIICLSCKVIKANPVDQDDELDYQSEIQRNKKKKTKQKTVAGLDAKKKKIKKPFEEDHPILLGSSVCIGVAEVNTGEEHGVQELPCERLQGGLSEAVKVKKQDLVRMAADTAVTFCRRVHGTPVDLEAFKGSNWGTIKGYGNSFL